GPLAEPRADDRLHHRHHDHGPRAHGGRVRPRRGGEAGSHLADREGNVTQAPDPVMEAEGVEETTAAEEETAEESPADTTESGASEASEATELTKHHAGAAAAGAANIADASAYDDKA